MLFLLMVMDILVCVVIIISLWVIPSVLKVTIIILVYRVHIWPMHVHVVHVHVYDTSRMQYTKYIKLWVHYIIYYITGVFEDMQYKHCIFVSTLW